MLITLHFRLKDSVSRKLLTKLSKAVNIVFNYCNEISYRHLKYQYNIGIDKEYKSKWLSEFVLNKLTSGSHVIWLDQVLPIYKKSQFKIEAVIGMVKSTNHRFRIITIYELNIIHALPFY